MRSSWIRSLCVLAWSIAVETIGLAADVSPPLVQPGESLYVAVGYGGRRMSSRDGVTWENVQQWADKGADDSNNLIGVAFGHGRFVAVGGGGFSKETQAGHILVSTDGKEWKEVAKYPFRVSPVLFTGERFVAGGPSRQLLFSDDGLSWKEGPKVDLPKEIPSWAFWFRKGVAGNGTYVFVGNAGKDQKIWWCLTTRDGTSIERFATDLPPVKGLAFGGGKFVIASADGVLTSAEGKKWTAAAPPQEEFTGVVWTGKEFVLTGKKQVYRSPDAAVWTPAGKSPPGSLVWADESVQIATGWPGKMFASTDAGKTWKATGQPMPAMGVNQVVKGALEKK